MLDFAPKLRWMSRRSGDGTGKTGERTENDGETNVEARQSHEGLVRGLPRTFGASSSRPETGKATEISWYISGKVEMVSPARATVDVAKRIATKVIDHQIASEAKWKAAETRYQRGLFLRR